MGENEHPCILLNALGMQSLKGLVAECLENLEPFSSNAFSALKWVERQTHTRTNHAQMLTGWEEGAFLATFAARVGARKVLEIGTFTGFSLICLADGTAKRERAPIAEKATKNKSRIDAIEINDELKYIIDEAVTRAGYSSCTTIYYGDAKAIIPTLNGSEQYDLVFIDANKREYLHYYNLVFPLVRPKGYIIADNVLWYGKAAAADNQQKPDAKTLGIREFNALIESDTRIEKELISIRDGLYIIQKL